MDVFQSLINMGNDFLSQLQLLGGIVMAISLGGGAFQQMTGGSEGMRKAKPWYIGAVVGFIVLLGAGAISAYVKQKTQF